MFFVKDKQLFYRRKRSSSRSSSLILSVGSQLSVHGKDAADADKIIEDETLQVGQVT